MYIEFEKQERQPTTSRASYRDANQTEYTATQKALLFRDGEKYPDKFDYNLYRGDNKQLADSSQPLPAGKYKLKETAFGVAYGNFNCDASQIEPLNATHQKAA